MYKESLTLSSSFLSDSASLSPPAFSVPRLPNVSSIDRIYSPPPAPSPVARTSTLPTNGTASPKQSEPSAIGDEANETSAAAQPKSKAAAKGKGKKGRGKSDEHKGMPEEEWEKSRRANHVRTFDFMLVFGIRLISFSISNSQKEVERRRRETINQGLDQLQALLPPPPVPSLPVGTAGTQKQNKSDILGHAINHIKEMRQTAQVDYNNWTLEKLLKDQEIKKGQQEIVSLKEENEKLKKRLQELEGSGTTAGGGDGEEERNAKRRRIEGEPASTSL